MVIEESKVMPKFLMVGDGVITSEPIRKVMSESLLILWEDAAMRNSVFDSLSLSMFFISHARSSSAHEVILKTAHDASLGTLESKDIYIDHGDNYYRRYILGKHY